MKTHRSLVVLFCLGWGNVAFGGDAEDMDGTLKKLVTFLRNRGALQSAGMSTTRTRHETSRIVNLLFFRYHFRKSEIKEVIT